MNDKQYEIIIERIYKYIMENIKSTMQVEELENLFKKNGISFLKQIKSELLVTKDKEYSDAFYTIIQDYLNSLKEISILSPGLSTELYDAENEIRLNIYCGKMSDIPNDDSITEETVFDTSSMTKLFTSILLLKEQEKGNIDLNKTFADYSHILKKIDIPIIEALRFSAIIKTDKRVDEKGISKEERVKRLLSSHIVERDTYEYNDLPYMLVPFLFGNTIEEATENYIKKFFELFRDELGLEKTGYSTENMSGGIIKVIYDKKNNEFLYSRGELYDPKARLFENEVGFITAHAGVTTTAKDLEKLFDLLKSGRVISEESIEKLVTSIRPGIFELLDENGNAIVRNNKKVNINHGMGVYINTGGLTNSTVFPAYSPNSFNAYGSTGASALFDLKNGFLVVKFSNYRSGIYHKWVRVDKMNLETTLISGTESLRDGSLIINNQEMKPLKFSNDFNVEEIKTLLKLRIAKLSLKLKAYYECDEKLLEKEIKKINEAFNSTIYFNKQSKIKRI